MRKFVSFFFILSAFLGMWTKVHAQQTNLASANLYAVDYSAFPSVSALMDVFDPQGIFVSGLTPQAVSVIEDGQPIPVDSLIETAVPLQLVVAVNQGDPLGVRDTAGFTRFQHVSQVLAQWAQSRPPDPPDDFSLVSQAGPVINHANAADFVVGLNAFQPDFKAAVPNLLSLSVALDTVSAQTPRLGMKRAILFITPHMDDVNLAEEIAPLAQRATQNNIRIFVWYVDLDTTFATSSAAVFNSLAVQTGGSMFEYSGLERFPDPEIYFSPLRRVYTVTYTSRLKTGGDHTISFQVNPAFGQITTNQLTTALDVQPPNPIPITPSLQITRQAPPDDPFNTDRLLPTQQELDIIIEFPDKHKRPLTRTTLYVDGKVAAENTTAPFDKFIWDLSSYTTSGEHQVVVEAVDSLGLSKQSMAIPITVTVIQPPHGPAALLAKYRTAITFGAILVAGLALLLILLGGRLRFLSLRAAREARRANTDPVTQPIKMAQEVPISAGAEKGSKTHPLPRKTTPVPKSRKDAAASLMWLTSDGQIAAVSPIAITEKETVFGTDPIQCNQILDDPSISSVHARLRQTEDGGYLLLDNNSIAGTWVNYEPLAREGRRLIHGDMVNFGQLAFRFALRTPLAPVKPTVTIHRTEE